MKITKVEPYYLRVPMRRAVADSFNVAVHVGLAGVQLTTDKGLVGNGFTATLAAGDDLIRDAIERYYTPILMGRDPHFVKQIWHELYWSPLHWVGRQGITTMAMAAVDIALWDLIAKEAEQPLWAILGGAKSKKIKTYNTDAGWLNMSVDEMTTYMKQIIDQGWTGVKMKVGKPDPREDYNRVRAVRKAIGDEIDLMIDVNQTWDLNTAMVWGKRLEEFQPGWLEEPLAPEDIRSHRILARELNTPIALGEHIYSKEVFRDYLLQEAVEVMQLDVTRLAGVTEWMQAADMAGCFNCPVIPHTADAGLVHQHLVAATQNAPKQECVPYGEELFLHPVDIREGWLHIPEIPGASTEFKPDQFAKLRVA